MNLASITSPTFAEDAQRYGQALVLAAGLRKELPSTYGRQQGAGKLRIFANGEQVGEAALGSAMSARDCLAAPEVLDNAHTYTVDGSVYPSFVPYARYGESAASDAVSLGGPPIGTTCKAFKIRNESAFFGCAKAEGVNAGGDMDDITLIWGPGRASYDNVDHTTGAPKNWPIGVSYTRRPYVAR